MSAQKRGHDGAKIIGAILDAYRQKIVDQKSRRPISYQEAAKRCGFRSAQHFHRICKGTLPLQYYHLDKVAAGLGLCRDELEQFWAVGRLLDDRVPPERLSVLCPRGVTGRRPTPGVAGRPAGPGDAGHAGVPEDHGGHGGPKPPVSIDVDLLIRLIQQQANLAPADGKPNGRFLWLISRLVGLPLLLSSSIRDWLMLIRCTPLTWHGDARPISPRTYTACCSYS